MTHRDVGEITQARYDELAEACSGSEECLDELVGQHRSETAMFGDSWPGAQIQIAQAREALAEMREDLDFMKRVLEASDDWHEVEVEVDGFGDIPF